MWHRPGVVASYLLEEWAAGANRYVGFEQDFGRRTNNRVGKANSKKNH